MPAARSRLAAAKCSRGSCIPQYSARYAVWMKKTVGLITLPTYGSMHLRGLARRIAYPLHGQRVTSFRRGRLCEATRRALAAISHNGVQFKVTGVREEWRQKRVAAGRPLPAPLVAGGAGSAMLPLWLILGWVGGGQAATAVFGGAFTTLSRSMARQKTFFIGQALAKASLMRRTLTVR